MRVVPAGQVGEMSDQRIERLLDALGIRDALGQEADRLGARLVGIDPPSDRETADEGREAASNAAGWTPAASYISRSLASEPLPCSSVAIFLAAAPSPLA